MKVKIKTWEKMLNEFNVLEDVKGNQTISLTRGFFTQTMENNIPADRIINVEPLDKFYYRWVTKKANHAITREMVDEFLDDFHELEQTNNSGA